mgnify:CR=1 FL=1
MKNKIELKKMCITSCIVIIIFLITFSILIYKQYKTYTYNFNQKIVGIIDNVLEKYPDIEKREIVEILNSSDKTNNEILREYGIELDKDSVILENNTDFQKFIIIDISTLILFILILSIIFFKYNHSESKKINEITKYIEEINRGNYKLNIEENTEDELSILKNELYKITIMLKEVAENSQKDKTTLKDSLSDISQLENEEKPVYNTVTIQSNNPDQLEKDIDALHLDIRIYNIDASAKEESAMVLVTKIFLYGFITVITLIGITNIFNTITSNMELRQKEFAMLKSIGMTSKEFDRMINLETIFYGTKAWIIGTIMGLFGTFAIYKAFSVKIQKGMYIPTNAILISAVFVFIFIFIIMRYSIYKINKQNTIETIRNENV